jgi:hypothetical protein
MPLAVTLVKFELVNSRPDCLVVQFEAVTAQGLTFQPRQGLNRPSETGPILAQNHAERANVMKAIARILLLLGALSSNAHAVVMGNLAGIDDYSSVGSVISGGGGLGSFVAISDLWVLTAAHVVDSSDSALLVGGHPNAPPVGLHLGGEAFFLFVDDIIIHPGYTVNEFHDDLALIKLSDVNPILPTDQSMSFATFSSVPLPGTLPVNATVTGYGQEEIGVEQTEFNRRSGSVPTDTADPFATVGVTPFPTIFPTDCGGGAIHCVYGTVGGAPGDSGGGMFANTAGGPVVTAINSFIFDENDLDPNILLDWTDGYWTVGTSVAAYEDWIKNPETGVFTGANFSSAAFVPLPPAIWLLGSSIFGLIAVARKKAAA